MRDLPPLWTARARGASFARCQRTAAHISATVISLAASSRISGARAVSFVPARFFSEKSHSTTRNWRGPTADLGVFGNFAVLGESGLAEHWTGTRKAREESWPRHSSRRRVAKSYSVMAAAEPRISWEEGVDDLFGVNCRVSSKRIGEASQRSTSAMPSRQMFRSRFWSTGAHGGRLCRVLAA